MSKASGSSSGFVNENEVLEVKPLRVIYPIFSNPLGNPFAGDSPSGAAPVYQPPFDFDDTIPFPVEQDSYRTPKHSRRAVARSSKKRRGRPRKKATAVNRSASLVNMDDIVANYLRAFGLIGLEQAQQATGNKDLVGRILMVYNLLRKKMNQMEDSRGDNPGFTRRPDLTAGTILLNQGIRTNNRKIVGAAPGIEVGDIFFFRMEMCLVGLHSPIMAGIDYMSVKISAAEEPMAVSIVSSGEYEDEGGYGDVLIYSGQGGVERQDGQLFDQKLERGNLALEKSLHRGNEVRVIRGLKDVANGTGKVYLYDGLYKIYESWGEKGKAGCHVFKYKLVRIPGQPKAFTLWKSIQLWKDSGHPRTGMILPDLTSGEETLPVCLVNEVDNAKGPAYFTYLPSLQYEKPFELTTPSLSCTCSGGCQPGDSNCPCNTKNGCFMPYTSIGVLLSYQTILHECGPSCLCPLTCRNRVSQSGLKVRLEVFKTNNRGWGLRSWDPIRSGQFICVYGGEVIDTSKAIELRSAEDNHYIFDATRAYPSLENVEVPFPLVISSYRFGNVARFMNHSCSPNVFWQPVLREENNGAYLDVAFHAVGHIPPLQELTFDYGVIQNDTEEQWNKKCLCGSSECRGFFY